MTYKVVIITLASYVLGVVVSTLQILTHLILPDNIIDRYCCYSYITAEKTEAPRV